MTILHWASLSATLFPTAFAHLLSRFYILHRVGHDWSDLAAAEVTNWASLVAQLVQNPTANAGDARDVDLIPGSGRSPGERNSSPLQYSCLENPLDRGAWRATVHWVTKSRT